MTIHKSDGQPTSLAIDLAQNIIYWVDVGESSLWTSDLNGQGARMFAQMTNGGFLNGLLVYRVCNIGQNGYLLKLCHKDENNHLI